MSPAALAPVAFEAEESHNELARQRAALVWLVLLPSALPRNQFFKLYEAPAWRALRRRASELRSVVKQLHAAQQLGLRGEVIEEVEGFTHISYTISSLCLRRKVRLSSLERALVSVALATARGWPAEERSGALVREALGPFLTMPAKLPEPSAPGARARLSCLPLTELLPAEKQLVDSTRAPSP